MIVRIAHPEQISHFHPQTELMIFIQVFGPLISLYKYVCLQSSVLRDVRFSLVYLRYFVIEKHCFSSPFSCSLVDYILFLRVDKITVYLVGLYIIYMDSIMLLIFSRSVTPIQGSGLLFLLDGAYTSLGPNCRYILL